VVHHGLNGCNGGNIWRCCYGGGSICHGGGAGFRFQFWSRQGNREGVIVGCNLGLDT
jgi:hypothetical protein